MIEEIMKGEEMHNKADMSIREMTWRTDPTNPSSPVIKRKFKPLDNPDKILDVLAGILVIKQGIAGNNVTTGPLQFAYWRGCITGTALSYFNQAAIEEGNETLGNLLLVERKLVKFFMPREVLRMQTSYMRLHMKKPKGTSTRQYVGAVKTLNEKLVEMPPNFSTAQKLPASDIMHIMVSRAPQAHIDLMTEQGFDPKLPRRIRSSNSANEQRIKSRKGSINTTSQMTTTRAKILLRESQERSLSKNKLGRNSIARNTGPTIPMPPQIATI
jgi:hypothetical protein